MNIAIISLGCPKNQVDADVFCHALIKAGHQTVADPEQADIIIVNTCGFIQSAKEEAIENILMACQYKQQNPNLKVIVTGCLAERYKQQIIQEIPEVDAVVGIGSNAALPAIVRRVCADGADQIESYGPKSDMQLGGARVISTPRHYAYLKIAEGCNNGCYYCAIPLIRGALRSREINDCVAEARWLAGEGVRELILVAQDPTAYGEDWGRPGAICELLDRLQEIDGIRWIRILYAYPERISDAFIAAMVRNTKVVPYLDLPIQHCDDAVLKAMNRRGGRKEIEDAIARLRAAIPGITLRTTLIAGFPGETEEQYAELCDFVKTVRFDRLGCFAYSAEENTVAAKMPNQIDEETKQRRADHIMELQAEVSAEREGEKVGHTYECICDGVDDETGMYLLRTKADCPEIDMVYARDSREPADTNRDYGLCRKLPDGSLQPLGLPIWRWDTFYVQIVRSIFDGSWDNAATTRAVNYWWGLRSGAEDLEYQEALPSGTRQLLDLLETLQGSDNVHIFPEKLYDNEDNLHSPENRVYSPKELMEMDWLDACVHGKLPHYDELDVKTRTVLAINGLDNVKGLEK